MKKIKKTKYTLFRIVLFFTLVSLYIFSSTSKAAENSSIIQIKENEFTLGDINAPISIIEYASLSCSHCANFHHKTLPKLIDEYVNTGKVKITFRYIPFNYPALMGSMLLQCIDKNIRYDYSTVLFELQSTWVNQDPEISKKELYKIMQIGGMSKEEFNKCLNNKDLENIILQDLIDAQNELSISSTPSFVINEKLLIGNKSIKEFRKIIDEILDSIK